MTRHVLHDSCGWPLIPLGGGSWIHALPVTVYHLERCIWSAGVGGLDPEVVLPPARPHPEDVAVSEVPRLWACRVTAVQATDIALWLGGRLPTRTEWLAAERLWLDAGALRAALQPGTEGDDRIGRLIAVLQRDSAPVHNRLLPPGFGEYASEYGRGRGAMFIMSSTAPEGMVTLGSEVTYRSDDVSFRCVFDAACAPSAAET